METVRPIHKSKQRNTTNLNISFFPWRMKIRAAQVGQDALPTMYVCVGSKQANAYFGSHDYSALNTYVVFLYKQHSFFFLGSHMNTITVSCVTTELSYTNVHALGLHAHVFEPLK